MGLPRTSIGRPDEWALRAILHGSGRATTTRRGYACIGNGLWPSPPGFYLCEQLVAAGWQVTGSYRSERPELDRLRDVGVELVPTDFTREGGGRRGDGAGGP